ncbi:MAG: hypothetical protein M0Q38_09435 [Bacteroidales bacterium]|jgi:hypothetical protein|nr:hypothetical protein [Bacteroidales bacterium]
MKKQVLSNENPCINSTGEIYSITPLSGTVGYAWTVPTGSTITSGQRTSSIIVNFGNSNGAVFVSATHTKQPESNYLLIALKLALINNVEYIRSIFYPCYSPSGQPTIAYSNSPSAKATVVKFDGDNWVNVGNASFTPEGSVYSNPAYNTAAVHFMRDYILFVSQWEQIITTVN